MFCKIRIEASWKNLNSDFKGKKLSNVEKFEFLEFRQQILENQTIIKNIGSAILFFLFFRAKKSDVLF